MYKNLREFFNDDLIKFPLIAIAIVLTTSIGTATINYTIIKYNYAHKTNVVTQSGNVFLLTPSGKINLGDYVGEYSADKNQTVWMDKNGSKHMTTAAVEFVENKRKK